MRNGSLKLPDEVDDALEAMARFEGSTKSALIREALSKMTAAKRKRPSILDLAGDLVGSLEGPGDLSTNPKYLDDFGR